MYCHKYFISFLIICLFNFCYGVESKNGKTKGAKPNGEIITDFFLQDSLFRNLEQITQNAMPSNIKLDSVAFLILPVEASCPSCRNKAIDSIAKHIDNLDEKHIIIIQGDGIKSISGYFEIRHKRLPIKKNVFYDSLGITLQTKMTDRNPAIYYSSKAKVFRKINCMPSSIKEDLKGFFAF
jgi:hypothetical protein